MTSEPHAPDDDLAARLDALAHDLREQSRLLTSLLYPPPRPREQARRALRDLVAVLRGRAG